MKPLIVRLLFVLTALAITFLGTPTGSAQQQFVCNCSHDDECLQRHGDLSYRCVKGGCDLPPPPSDDDGLCKKISLSCVPNPSPICPQIYDPVICNDGITYTNPCYAAAACAEGCVPGEA